MLWFLRELRTRGGAYCRVILGAASLLLLSRAPGVVVPFVGLRSGLFVIDQFRSVAQLAFQAAKAI